VRRQASAGRIRLHQIAVDLRKVGGHLAELVFVALYDGPSIAVIVSAETMPSHSGQQVAISVAGGMAAEMSRGGTFDPNSYGNCHDLRSVRQLFRPFQKLEETPEYHEGLQLADRVLRKQWQKVEALANALLRQRQLSSQEIYNILQPSGNRFDGF
jgi:hypothetical protein